MLTFHTVAQQERPGFLYDGICNQGTRSCSNFIIYLSWSFEPINCSVPCRKHQSLPRQHCISTALPVVPESVHCFASGDNAVKAPFLSPCSLPSIHILLLILHTSQKLLTCVMQARLLVSREMKNSAFKYITKYFKYTLP